jgi:hypothetical protein
MPSEELDLREARKLAATKIAAIQRGERGLPADPRSIMVKGRWVDGPTLVAR